MRDLASGKEGFNNNNNNSSTNNNNNNNTTNNNLRNGRTGTPSPPMLPTGSNQQCLPHPNCPPGSGNSMMLGPNIHQMQQLIQQQLLTPAQLQSLMQQQTLLFQHQV